MPKEHGLLLCHLQFEVSPHVFDWVKFLRQGRGSQSITVTPFSSKKSSLSSFCGRSVDLLEAIIPATVACLLKGRVILHTGPNIPSTLWRNPIPLPLKHPHTISFPLPNLMVGGRHFSLYLSACLLIYTLLVELINSKLLSSDHSTRFQSSTDHCLCLLPHMSRAFNFFADSRGFFAATHPHKPALFNLYILVLVVT